MKETGKPQTQEEEPCPGTHVQYRPTKHVVMTIISRSWQNDSWGLVLDGMRIQGWVHAAQQRARLQVPLAPSHINGLRQGLSISTASSCCRG